jgi:putative hydrolase of the HAD superfamily
MINGVVFDFGGVLMRTGDPAGRREWESQLGLAPGRLEQVVHGSEEWIKAQRGQISVEDYWRAVAAELKIAAERVPALQADYFRDDSLDYDLVKLIADLRSMGYKVGLLSNDALTLETKLRDQLGLYHAFDAVVISAIIGIMKPDPGAYHAIAQALGVEPATCVFIDDNSANIEGARRVGMRAIHYRAGMDLRAALSDYLNDKKIP